MSVQPIEGRVISPSRSGREPAAPGPPPPRTEYVYLNNKGGSSGGGGGRRTLSWVRGEPRKVPVSQPWIPSFFGNRTLLAASWLISMTVVGFDDWHNQGILPRPSRLWATSLFFGLLALASLIDAIVPLVNALAIGYTIMLLWNYYAKGGQFA